MDFPSREELTEISNITDMTDIRNNMLVQLKNALSTQDTSKWADEPNIKINQIEKQKEFFWIRIYLLEEDDKLKVGDSININYKPTNEKLEMYFGGYEKEGLNKDHDSEVINYISDDDKTILCCMIDLNRVNKESNDIPTVRTFFRNSRHYKEELYYKSDIIISTDDKEYEYSSIAF